jgi:aldehyde dehydrogenase (NAD+)
MSEIFNSNFSSNYLRVVEGDAKETTELLNYRYDKIFFTGSVPVGKIIYQAAAKHLTPVSLELGGKNPTFVLADANIRMTAKRIIWGKFMNAGQTCIAPDYILVDKAIETKLINAFKRELESYPKNSDEKADHYVKIINTRNFDRLNQLINKDRLCYGGNINREARFIGPTILQDITFDDEVMKDEIFGPILPVLSFSNLDEVVKKVKERPKPLACYIYSRNKQTIKKLLKEISFGGGAINESNMHWSNKNLPFGGVGLSGIGKYRGKAGFESFTHYKSILNKPFWFESDVKYPPYSKAKSKLIKWIFE